MNAQDAKLLTLATGMKLIHRIPTYELWEGDILYSFISSGILDMAIDDIMKDPCTLCVWTDPNGNGVISVKI